MSQQFHYDAEEVLDRARGMGMPWRPPIDVYNIARMLGASVYDDPTLEDRGIIGEIRFLNSNPVISLNPVQNAYTPRKRFTLAHELGHLCLHSNERDGFTDSRQTMSRTESYWDRFESEANNFAAELLMPVDLIAEYGNMIWRNYRENHQRSPSDYILIGELAYIFEVSHQAMEYRLQNLGFIDRN